jgi:hypothetical protein
MEVTHVLLGADYPLLDVFWTMLIFFVWIAWFMLLFRIIADIFRRHDIGGGAKAAWLIFVILLPFLGVFVYIIAESKGMTARDLENAEAQKAQFDAYVQSAAGSGGAATEIEKAKQLLDTGAITKVEFDAIKTKALAAA